MRKFERDDVFPAARILKKINLKVPPGIKDEIELMGFFMDQLLTNLPEVQTELTEFLASIMEKKVEEVKHMPIDEIFKVIGEFFKFGELKSFFDSVKSVAKLAQVKSGTHFSGGTTQPLDTGE